MTAWEVYEADLGWGVHPVVVISHPARAARKEIVEILDCATQRAGRAPQDHEVMLDQADGLDWPIFCKCDCIYAVPRHELKKCRGTVVTERRRQIVRTLITAHAWNAV